VINGGKRSSWLVLDDGHDPDGARRTTLALPVQGKGVMLQVVTKEAYNAAANGGIEPGRRTMTEPVLIPEVCVIQYARHKVSDLLNGEGAPVSVETVIEHQELVSATMVAKRFNQKGDDRCKPGAVITLQVGPQSPIVKANAAQPAPPSA